MENQEIEELLREYQELMEIVLSKVGIYKRHAEYDDCLQELRILCYEMIVPFNSRETFEKQYPKGFLFQKLCWHVRDFQRRNRKIQAKESGDELLLEQLPAEIAVELREYFTDLWAALQQKEQKMLLKLLQENEKPLSRQTRHHYRKQLRKKFQKNEKSV